MITIAALNYWRGRGYDAPIKLHKWAFFLILNAYCLMMYDWQVALQLSGVFGIIFSIGTGEMMQGQHGKQQEKIKLIFRPIYWIISKFTPLQGKLCGFYFNTILGIILMMVNLWFGFSFFYLGFTFLGIVIYLSKRWDYAEFNMALLWAAIIIGANYAN